MVRLSASGCNIKSRYLTLPLHKMHAACFSHRKKTQSKSREQCLQKISSLLNSWINSGLSQGWFVSHLFTQDRLVSAFRSVSYPNEGDVEISLWPDQSEINFMD